jgi:hypothetical protein
MATSNNENNTNTTTIDLPDLDTTNTNHINKYIEKQVNKVLNIDQNTTSTTIFPNDLDNIIADAIPIWNVLGLTEQEYLKKFFDK